MDNESGSLRLTVDGGADLTPDEIESLVGSLRAELLELDLDAVRTPTQVDFPLGAKAGAAHTVGVLIASGVFSASTVKAIATVASAWIQRSGARSVSICRGDSALEITGTSKHQVNRLVEQWLDEQRRNDPE